jgi:hypothetical protein
VVEDITATPAPASTAPSSTLGYAEVVADSGTITAETDLTGLSTTVTVAAGRRIRITLKTEVRGTAGDVYVYNIKEGSTVLQRATGRVSGTASESVVVTEVLSPSAGAHTYKATLQLASGTGVINGAASTYPASFLIEDITAAITSTTYSIQPAQIQPGTFQTGLYVFPAGVNAQGAASTNADVVQMQKVGAVGAANIYWAYSHRSTNTDLLLYGYDGTTFKNMIQYSYATAAILITPTTTISGDLVVNGTNFEAFAGTLCGASGAALKTVGINVNGNLSGLGGTGAVGLRSRSGGNIVSFDWGSPFTMWVDVTNVKTFVIPHPTDNERYLVHACIEAPEALVQYRGQAQLDNGWVRIDLPAYFEALCAIEGRSVQLTAIADDPLDEWCPVLHATYPKDGRFWVGLGSGVTVNDQRFWWQVTAVRKDVPPVNVEPLTDTVDVLGAGPYTYTKEK